MRYKDVANQLVASPALSIDKKTTFDAVHHKRASHSGTDDARTRLCYISERIKPDGRSDCRGEDIPKADVVVKWTFEIGKTLVPPEVVSVQNSAPALHACDGRLHLHAGRKD